MKTLRLLVLAVIVSLGFSTAALSQTEHAFLWDSVNGMQDLGTLGGNNSYAFGINDNGTVAGYSYLADNVTFHAFRWTPTTGMVDIGATRGAGFNSYGAGINASGNVAATVFDSEGTALPSIFHSPGFWKNVTGSVSNLNRSYGMNDLNQVTGQLVTGSKAGFLWTPATGAITYFPNLSGGDNTIGVAVNNLSHVTGAASVALDVYDAFFWNSETGTRDLGSLNQSAFTAGGGINDRDEVVGYTLPELYGFYWSKKTGMIALPSLGGTVSAAFGITHDGRIVGYGGLGTGAVHAVLRNNYTSSPTDLGTLGGTNSYGKGLNRAGQVVGFADVP